MPETSEVLRWTGRTVSVRQMGTWRFSDLLHTLDSRQEVRFREFERICRWFLLNAPEYRSRIGQVWLWSDWPEAWGRDAGIDLIAEERDGGLWAIQAKLYEAHRGAAV